MLHAGDKRAGQEEFAAAALPIPVFETNSGGVLVTIPRGNITKNVTKNVTKTMPNNTLVNNEIVEQHITKHITKNVTKTTPITLSGAALKVVRMIEKNPNITTAQMAEVIGVAKKNLIAFTNNLQRDGIIRHIGPARGGHWEVTM